MVMIVIKLIIVKSQTYTTHHKCYTYWETSNQIKVRLNKFWCLLRRKDLST